jgi:outer membrane PBP1 activator LpoA protein
MRTTVRKFVAPILVLGMVLAGCSTSSPSHQARELADACNAISHISLTHLEVAAASGQRSGDAELAREAARLQIDLKGVQKVGGVPAIIDASKMMTRCRQLNAWS